MKEEAVSVELIGPELAKHYLAKNSGNRAERNGVVRVYARAMKSGEWVFNGHSIVFDTNDKLIDGQHRMRAVVESGVTIKCVVFRNCSLSAFKTIDIGAKRKGADFLSIEGHQNCKTMSSIAVLVHKMNVSGNPFNGTPENSPSPTQIINICKNDSRISESAKFSQGNAFIRKVLTPSIGGFCHFIFLKDNQDIGNEFFNNFIDGEKGYEGSPILLLRDQLILDTGSKRKMTKHYKTALIFKAYKLYKSKTKIKMLRIRIEGDAPEKDLFFI